MSTITEVKAVLTAEDRASAVVQNLKNQIDQLSKSVRSLASIKMPDVKTSVAPSSATKSAVESFTKGQAAAMKASRAQLAFAERMNRQRAGEARTEERRQRNDAAATLRAFREKSMAVARLARQQAGDARAQERDRRAVEAATMASIRRLVAFTARMSRQRATEERAGQRERQRADAAADRDAAASLRRRIAGDNWRFALRERMQRRERQQHDRARRDLVSSSRDTWQHGREAVRDITRPSAAAAAIGTGATIAATRSILRSESDVDAAEINTRAYGGLNADAARQLRDGWAAPLSEALGSGTADLLKAWTDSMKLGMPATGARAVAELATKTSSAWEVPFESVTDILGTVNSLLTSKGEAFSVDRLKSVANTIQYLAAKQSTTPEKLISYLQRGAGAAQVLGMSQEAGLAFGSASTSLGNQAGSSGRLLDYIASRVIELPRLTKQHGEEGKQARKLIEALGYGSAEAMDNKRRKSPDDFLPDLLGRLNKIKNPKDQDKSLRFLFGREWLGEGGRIVKGIETYKEAVKLAKEAKGLDAIGAVWELHRTKLSFVFRQFRAGWLNILGEVGKVLSPMARQAGDYFLAWSAKLRDGGLAARFKAALEGLVNGLGFKDFPALLTGIFGKPGEGTAGSIEAWRAAARGFGAGIRDVIDSFMALIRTFSGGKSDPETIGRWTARILGFSAALVIASPVIGILTGIGAALVAFTAAAQAAAAIWRLIKLPAAPGGAPGPGPTAAAGGGLMGWLRGLMRLAPAVAMPLTIDPSKADRDRLMERLGRYAEDRERERRGETGAAPAWGDPPARVQRQSAGETWHGMIRPASFGGLDDLARSVDRMGRGFDALGAKLQRASFSGPGAAAVASFGGGGGLPGTPGDPAKAFGGQFYTPPGKSVPGWFGRGSTNGLPDPGTGAGAGPYKPVLDYIAKAEGTAGQAGGGYNTSLGYGKYLPGRVEQNLTGKSLNEILALGDHMRRQPGNPNSSALGRYQIVGKTLRGLMGKLGLLGSEKFDEAMQDRLGAELVRQRGANATGLGNEWASLKGGKGQEAASLVGQIPRGASTTPGARETAPVSGPAGDVIDRIQALKRSGAITNEQCVALAKAYVGVSGSVMTWRKGEGAETGTLKPGTPVATFLNRDGSQSDRYAGGGTGTMGAHLDHAGVFQKYIRDASGKAIGMTIAEQFKGHGPRLKDYLFGKGWGEGNGSNYHAIMGPDGKPLGGANNPMSPSATAQAAAASMKPRNAFGGIDAMSSDAAANGNVRQAPTPDALAGSVPAKPTAQGLADQVPAPRPVAPVPADRGQGGRAGGDVHIHQVIHGAGEDPHALAGKVQRHVTEAWSYRSHDLEPELT